MPTRLELHAKLVELLGSTNVYFQPPESQKLNYPAIVYSKNDLKNNFADDDFYLQSKQYKLTFVDPDPDSELFKKASKFMKAKFVTSFATQGLNHEVYTIYY